MTATATRRTSSSSSRNKTGKSRVTSGADKSGGPPPITRPIGKYERLAYERQERDLRLAYGDRWDDYRVYGDPSKSKHPKGFYFDVESGHRVILFIERFCRHYEAEWAGQLIKLEHWQKFVLYVVFGWKRPDGTRRFRTGYEEVPRKNGKSLKASGVGNYLLVADNEPGAQVYTTATKERQAKIVWGGAKEMVSKSVPLKKHVRIRHNRLSCARLNSFFEPLGADSETLDGLNVHGHIPDELHKHKDRHVYDVMITGMGSRRQPLTFGITTAGVYDPESIGWELHEHAQQVLEEVVEDDEFFAIIFAADEGDDPFAQETWAKANPNLGVSVKLDFLQSLAEKAKTQPSFLNTFKRYHLNLWTETVATWIPTETWKACDGRAIDIEQLRGRVCFAGLDLSSKIDIAAVAFTFPPMVDGVIDDAGVWEFLWAFYCPEELVKSRARKKGTSPDYAKWEREGWLRTTPGNVIDFDFIRNDIKAANDEQGFMLREIGFDPWDATQFSLNLQSDGFTVVEIRQGMPSMSEPSKEFEKLATAGRIRHANNPVMRWMVANAAVRRDANDNIAPDKKSAKGKIDGVVASIMAIKSAIRQPKSDGSWRPM